MLKLEFQSNGMRSVKQSFWHTLGSLFASPFIDRGQGHSRQVVGHDPIRYREDRRSISYQNHCMGSLVSGGRGCLFWFVVIVGQLVLRCEQRNRLLSQGQVSQNVLDQATLVKGKHMLIVSKNRLMERHRSPLRLARMRAIGDWHLARSGRLGVPVSLMKSQIIGKSSSFFNEGSVGWGKYQFL